MPDLEPQRTRVAFDFDPAALRLSYHDDGTMPRGVFDELRLGRISDKIREANGSWILSSVTVPIDQSLTPPSS